MDTRLVILAPLLACAALVLPSAASAAVLTFQSGINTEIAYTGEPGEANRLELRTTTLSAEQYTFEMQIDDKGAVIRSETDKCRVVSAHRAFCTVEAELPVFRMGDGDDRFSRLGGTADHYIEAEGGPGDDRLYGLAATVDVYRGDEGNDQLRGELGTAPTQTLTVFVEDRLHGGPGNDYLRTDYFDAMLAGGEGADSIVGGSGDDTLYGGPEDDADSPDGDDVITGNGGNDVIAGHAGSDLLRGGDGDDRLFGDHDCSGDWERCSNPGDDRLEPGNGRDEVTTGIGGAYALTRDFFRDTVHCSAEGDERVNADPLDVVGAECDTVFVALPDLLP